MISKNYSNGWPRRVLVGHWARTGFLQAHGRPSFSQRRFHRSIPTGLGSICERCSFGFKRTRRELALPIFVGWRGFLGAMIRSQPANGRWSLVRRNRGYRPRDENGREPEAALHRRFQIRHWTATFDDDTASPAELKRDTDAKGPRRRFSLARKSEAFFSHGSPLNLPASVFAGITALGFLSYIIGIHNVTYGRADGSLSRLGFFGRQIGHSSLWCFYHCFSASL